MYCCLSVSYQNSALPSADILPGLHRSAAPGQLGPMPKRTAVRHCLPTASGTANRRLSAHGTAQCFGIPCGARLPVSGGLFPFGCSPAQCGPVPKRTAVRLPSVRRHHAEGCARPPILPPQRRSQDSLQAEHRCTLPAHPCQRKQPVPSEAHAGISAFRLRDGVFFRPPSKPPHAGIPCFPL